MVTLLTCRCFRFAPQDCVQFTFCTLAYNTLNAFETSMPPCLPLVKFMLILTFIFLLFKRQINNPTPFIKILISGTIGLDFDHSWDTCASTKEGEIVFISAIIYTFQNIFKWTIDFMIQHFPNQLKFSLVGLVYINIDYKINTNFHQYT